MKQLLNKSKIYLLAVAFMAFGSVAMAQASGELNVVAQLEERVAQLELEMLDLKSINKRDLTKKERKALKIDKRQVRRALARYNDQLDRLTSPRFVGNPYYGYGYPVRRFYRPRVVYRTVPRAVVVTQACPAPAVQRQVQRKVVTQQAPVTRKTTPRTPIRHTTVRKPVRR